MSFANFRGGPCEKNPAIDDGVNVLSGDGWRHTAPPAFPFRVLYCSQPLCFGIRLPDKESVHAAVGGDSNIAAVAVVAVAIAITTVEEGSATNSTA